MTTRRSHTYRATAPTPSHPCLLRLLGVVAVAAPAILGTPAPAYATPITYTLRSVSASFPEGTVSLSGTFELDLPITMVETDFSVSLTASGPSPPLIATTLLYDTPEFATGATIFIRASIAITEFMFLNFNNDFNTTIPSDLAGLRIGHLENIETATDVTGFAVPSLTPTPEPASLALLGGALSLFLLTRRANRRDRSNPPRSTRRVVKPGSIVASPPAKA